MPPVHPPARPDVEAQILLFELPLALSRSSTLPIARDDALQAMLTFLIELMEHKTQYDKAPVPVPVPAPVQPQHQQQQQAHARALYDHAPPHTNHHDQHRSYYNNERPPPPLSRDDAYAQRSYPDDDHKMDGSGRYVARESGEYRDDERANQYRKRRYEPSRETWRDEPVHARRRVDDPYANAAVYDEKPPLPSTPSAPTVKVDVKEPPASVFFVDSAGERKPHADRTQRALTEEQRIKAEVDAYQGLVAQMFKNRDGLMAKLDQIDWDTQRETECIEFDDKFTVRLVRTCLCCVVSLSDVALIQCDALDHAHRQVGRPRPRRVRDPSVRQASRGAMQGLALGPRESRGHERL